MGLDIPRDRFEEEDFARFGEKLKLDLKALALLLERPGFGLGPPSIGSELELNLVDADGRPALINQEVLELAADERLTRWLALYHEIARSNGGEPDAGRYLLSWAQRAGFTRIDASASAWCFATPEERAWWGGLWAERMTSSEIATQAIRDGRALPEELAAMEDGWRAWASAEDGWFAVLHGEIICTR